MNLDKEEQINLLGKLIQEKTGETPTRDSLIFLMNVSAYMLKLGRELNVLTLYHEIKNFDNMDDIDTWFSEKVLGMHIYREILEAAKKDPVKNTLDVYNMKIEDALQNADGTLIQHTTAGHSDVIQQIEKSIYRDIKETYIKRRNRRLMDGSIDRALTIDELEKCRREAMHLMDSNREIRNLEVNIKNNINTASIMNDMSVDFRYRFEQFKEVFCNKYRKTPESFDLWYQAIRSENMNIMDQGAEILDVNDEDRRQYLIKKYAFLLVPAVDIPEDQPVYESEFIKELDRKEEELIQRSKKKYPNFTAFDQMSEFTSRFHLRNAGINPDIIKPKFSGQQDGVEKQTAERIVERFTRARKRTL